MSDKMLDTRSSAFIKRAEQLKRWEESETNRQPTHPKNLSGRKIKFSSGCVFLASCIAGDKDEVVNLLNDGADINTANVDGLTALHQACIDDNLDMVEFLVQQGADIDRQDNEGWTPLHATVSCGFVSIAMYLIESGSDLSAINSDGDLCIDLAARKSNMEDVLQRHMDEKQINCDAARQSEQLMMLNDAKHWLRSDASEADRPHPRTGATALHVAAAKGYTKVLSLLLAGRADVDKQDKDGWTPLHAAAHWGQTEAAQMLVTSLADMDVKNYAGQSAIDIAHPDIVNFLDDLKKNNKRTKRKPIMEKKNETPPKVIRVEVKSDLKESEDEKPKQPSEPAAPIPKDKQLIEDDTPWRRANSLRTRTQIDSPPKPQVPENEVQPSDNDVILRRTQSFENDEKFYQKYRELQERIKANSCPVLPATQISVTGSGGIGNINNNNIVNATNNYIVQRSASLKECRLSRNKSPVWPPVGTTTTIPVAPTVRRSFVPPARDEESETQRKAHAKYKRETRRSTQGVTLDDFKSAEELYKKKNLNNNNNTNSDNTSSSTPLEVNDRVPSMHSDSNISTTATIETISNPEPVTASLTITTKKDNNENSASYTVSNTKETDKSKDSKETSTTSSSSPTTTITANVPSNNITKKTDLDGSSETKTSPTKLNNQQSSFNIEDNTLNNKRDKRSLFDIDNASSLSLADKLRNEANKYNEVTKSNNDLASIPSSKLGNNSESNDNDIVVMRKSDSTPSSPLHQNTTERRPSWRLKFDAGNKFKLEDASSQQNLSATAHVNNNINESSTIPITSSVAQRRQNNISGNITTATSTTTIVAPRPVSAPVISTAVNNDEKLKNSLTASETAALRRLKNEEDKENDKENDNRSGQTTQGVIQRRRRPKRRSTGVVRFDKDELDPDRQESPNDGDEKESGSEISTRSRLGSTNSVSTDVRNANDDVSAGDAETTENGEMIDYKALWEASKIENDKLKTQMKKKDDELHTTKITLERFTNATSKNSLSEIEKRERRAMERKMSEMEEELKHLDALRTENQRLKDENGALIRVISKLSK